MGSLIVRINARSVLWWNLRNQGYLSALKVWSSIHKLWKKLI